MGAVRFGLLLCLLLLSISVPAQQTQTPVVQPQPTAPQQTQPVTTPTPAPKDPQAVSVMNQALAVAGGTAEIRAVTDYTATGNITNNGNPNERGSVTVQALMFDQIRLDANLPRGMRSSVISAGQTTTKAEDGTLTQYPPPYPLPSSEAHPYQPPLFPACLVLPHVQLALVLNSPIFSVSDKGIVQLDGNSVHDVQAQLYTPGNAPKDSMSEYHMIDFFIDPNTFQVVMTQDNVPNHVVHQIRYSNYRLVNGVLVPFSISEQMGGQNTYDIQLSQISFNTGLQDSAFVLK